MRKAIAVFMLGLVCLFIGSITVGKNIFSSWERRGAAESQLGKDNNSHGLKSHSEREAQSKRIRLAMNSFDLANGLTFKELEDISLEPKYRFSAFLSLVASLWLVALLRKPRGNQI
jgi:hypothetical protein